MEMEETKIGRLAHKIEKLKTLGERTPGVEFMRSEVFSGDHGLAVIEHAPFGVIGAITPVTHSLPTITGNAVSMIAGGNTLVVNPHPSGKRVAAEGVRRFNEAIYRDLGIDNLICVIAEPTLESADAIFKHRGVKLICVTGGPAVARAAMNSGKRAIVAGPGNPPVVVDETADLDRAARCDHPRRRLRQQPAVHRREGSLRRRRGLRRDAGGHGAGRRRAAQRPRDRRPDQGGHHHRRRRRAQARRGRTRISSARTPPCWPRRPASTFRPTSNCSSARPTRSNPFVPVEQMMPFVPFVRVPRRRRGDRQGQALRARLPPHGIIHSNNVRNMTKMGRAMDTTLFVKNGPCMASLGLGGEGYLSFSIATPTGEGVTTPLTFTRERRCSLIDDLRILGKVTGMSDDLGTAVPHRTQQSQPEARHTMQLGTVVGTATATVKHPSMAGWKLLVVQLYGADGQTPDGEPVLAVDRARRRQRRDSDDHQRRQRRTRACWAARRRRSAGA